MMVSGEVDSVYINILLRKNQLRKVAYEEAGSGMDKLTIGVRAMG